MERRHCFNISHDHGLRKHSLIMFYLHASNRTENLLHHLGALVEADPLPPLSEQEYIIIQSQGMERMISQYMANRFTCWCNYRFFLPLTFLEVIAEKLAMDISPDSFERGVLCWRIEEKLRDLKDNVYLPLQNYLKGSQVALKRFQLARQLANLFDQYQLMRPQLLQTWKQGKVVVGNSSEQWQMHLWHRLVADAHGGRPRGELLQEIISVLNKKKKLADIPRRISVFGVHILPPLFLDYLEGLAKHTDIHFFLLSPCQNYWGDMTRRQAISKDGRRDPNYHPLLVSLGGQGRDFQEMLLNRGGFASEILSYEEPFTPDRPRLLHAVQADLLNGNMEERREGVVNDGSIRIVSCHSRERELAVLKDHLLDLLEKNDSLQLGEIVVMAPDIQEYAPFIPAHFEDIHHSIADRSITRSNKIISLFQQFLDLFSGRFGWSEVFDFLDNEEIQRKFQLNPADFESLRDWVVAAGVRWSLSAQMRKESGFSFVENSWHAGLERLLMGVMIDAEEEVAGILPYREIEGSQAAALGGLCEFIQLIEQAEADFKKEHLLCEWAELFMQYSLRLFYDTNTKDFSDLRGLLQKLAEDGDFHTGNVDLRVMAKWFSTVSRESRSASGFLKGGVTFCSMLPMRSIPFKAICVLGLNYGVFPENDRQPNYDLMKQQQMLGDRSLRADDRYQFLELLLACRQCLYLSYIGRSLDSNDPLPPSVVLNELMETLEEGYGVRNMVEQHPLHGFSSRYFTDDSPFFSYNDRDYRVALALAAESQERKEWWQGTIDDEPVVIELEDLFRFYTNPQLYFIQKCLDISLRDEESLPEDSELLELHGLQAYGVEQQLLASALEGVEASRLQRKLSESGQWPLGMVGEIIFAQKNEEIYEYAERIKKYEMGERLADPIVDITIGSYNLIGKLGNQYENGMLLSRYANFRAKDLLHGWLHHLIGERVGVSAQQTSIVAKDIELTFTVDMDFEPSLEDLLELYLRGRQSPCPLLVEPALAYCRQIFKQRARRTPLEEARKKYTDILEKGFEPSWQLLYQGLTVENVIAEDFTKLTERYFMPLWRVCHGS